MKKIILFPIILIMSSASFSQQTEPSTVFTKEDYLQKSKNQKTGAIVLLAGGGLLHVIGLSVWSDGFVSAFDFSNPDPNRGSSELNAGGVLMIFGSLAVLGSIPLFIASGKNKRKAMNMSFKLQAIPQLKNGSFVSQPGPSFSLKINL